MLESRIHEDLVWNKLVSSNVSPIVWNFLNNRLANKDNDVRHGLLSWPLSCSYECDKAVSSLMTCVVVYSLVRCLLSL